MKSSAPKPFKKIITSLLLVCLLLLVSFYKTTALETTAYHYSIRAFGIGFANCILKESIKDNTITLSVNARSKSLASLLYSVDNTYTTEISLETNEPLKQDKLINGKHFENLFSASPPGFLNEDSVFTETISPPHTLFSIFRMLSFVKPAATITVSAVSCNTSWLVTITPEDPIDYTFHHAVKKTRVYMLTFKSTDSHEVLKKRYDDILDKELFWNSGKLQCIVDETEPFMYEARLISASPEVSITLKDIKQEKD